jgi:hypothetical protein
MRADAGDRLFDDLRSGGGEEGLGSHDLRCLHMICISGIAESI